MTSRVLIFVTIAIVASFSARAESRDSRRVICSTKEDASFSLTLICSLDGIFREEERVFYFRAARDASDLGAASTSSTNADGAAGVFGLTATAKPRDRVVEVDVSAYWTSKNARGKSSVTLTTPYFASKKGRDAGFDYSLVWQKLK